ncbi:hypothetical protein D3C81_1911080 [compost metagenome]
MQRAQVIDAFVLKQITAVGIVVHLADIKRLKDGLQIVIDAVQDADHPVFPERLPFFRREARKRVDVLFNLGFPLAWRKYELAGL